MKNPNVGQIANLSIKNAELLIGIPTFKNAPTIGRVIATAAEGLQKYFPAAQSAIAIMDGGSSDATTQLAASQPLPPNVQRSITINRGITGRGIAVREILGLTRALKSKICIVLEADSLSLAPDWIARLASPILNDGYELAAPWYTRPLIEGGLTDVLAYPLTRVLYGADVRQPMGGDFAVAGEFAARLAERDVWETDVAKRGVDIWMTTFAINEHARMCQVRLGAKTSSPHDPIAEPTFVQSVGTLFRMMEIYQQRWQAARGARAIPLHGDDAATDLKTVRNEMDDQILIEAFLNGARRYRRLWRSILAPSHFKEIMRLSERPHGAQSLAPDLWARIVYDFAVVYNKGENDPDKVVAALLPIYSARLAALLHETNSKTLAVEKAVQAQAQHFLDERNYFLHRWRTYVPWAADGVR